MFEELLAKFAVGFDPALIDTCSNLFLTAFKEGLYAVVYLIYLFGIKIFLALTDTPDATKSPLYARIYKVLEWSVLIFGKVKQKPGETA